MLQPLYKVKDAPPHSAPSASRLIKVTLSDSSMFSGLVSKHISAWHIDVPSHFKSSQIMNLTKPIDSQSEELTMLNWVITFFLLAIVAAVFGFSGLAGAFSEIVKFIAMGFVVIFVASLIYSVITGRRSPTTPSS